MLGVFVVVTLIGVLFTVVDDHGKYQEEKKNEDKN